MYTKWAAWKLGRAFENASIDEMYLELIV